MFIVVEGMDYSGKSSLVRELKKKYEAQGKEVITYGNPGGTPFGQELRQIFKSDVPRSRMEDFLLLCANRVSLSHQIKKDLAEGKIVICDRWDISAHVYQAAPDVGQLKDVFYYRNMPLYEAIHDLPKPDVTVLLDVDWEIIKARSENVREETIGETDRYETNLKALHEDYRNVMAVFVACSNQYKKLLEHWNKRKDEAILYWGLPHPAMAVKPSERYLRLPVTSCTPNSDVSPMLADKVISMLEGYEEVYPLGKIENELNAMDKKGLDHMANACRDELGKWLEARGRTGV